MNTKRIEKKYIRHFTKIMTTIHLRIDIHCACDIYYYRFNVEKRNVHVVFR